MASLLIDRRVVLYILFSIGFLVFPNLGFAFFIAAENYVVIFLEPKSLSYIISQIQIRPNQHICEVRIFARIGITLHLLTLTLNCPFVAYSSSRERPFGTLHNRLVLSPSLMIWLVLHVLIYDVYLITLIHMSVDFLKELQKFKT